MVKLNENIRYIRKQLHYTQDQFAAQLDIKRSLIGAYEEGRATPKLELLQKIADCFNISVDTLISQDLTLGIRSTKDHKRSKDVLVVTVDESKKQNIQFVPYKAAAGYLNGYADAEFISELPRFRLPILTQGTYRAFEIKGDSMLPILPGTIVIGEYMENFSDIKNGQTYVLVTQSEGIVYKRLFNYIADNGKLFLVSDNRQYAPYPLDPQDVIEVWAAKAYISVQFPDLDSTTDVSIENLSQVVMNLQNEITQLKTKK